MSLVYVQTNEHLVCNEHDGQTYGSWKKVTQYTIEGVVLDNTKRWGYDAIQIAPAVIEGDEVWVLYMTYYDGDSFGSHDGQGEIIWVFIDEQVAKAAERKLTGAEGNPNSFRFADEDGEDICLSNPASDYFSGVEGFHLQKCIVGQCPDPSY